MNKGIRLNHRGHVLGWNHTVNEDFKTDVIAWNQNYASVCGEFVYCLVICKMYYDGYLAIDVQYEFRPQKMKFDSSLIFV